MKVSFSSIYLSIYLYIYLSICSQMFAQKLCNLVKDISDPLPMKTLSFLIDACQLLVQCHKVCLISSSLYPSFFPPRRCYPMLVLLSTIVKRILMTISEYSMKTLSQVLLHCRHFLVNQMIVM